MWILGWDTEWVVSHRNVDLKLGENDDRTIWWVMFFRPWGDLFVTPHFQLWFIKLDLRLAYPPPTRPVRKGRQEFTLLVYF